MNVDLHRLGIHQPAGKTCETPGLQSESVGVALGPTRIKVFATTALLVEGNALDKVGYTGYPA